MRLRAPRLGVALAGDRLAVAVVEGEQIQAFTIEAENPAAALRAELDARSLAPRAVALGLARALVSVKPIELPAVTGDVRDMVRFELDRHLPFPADDAPFDVAPLPVEAETREAGAPRRVLVVAADRRVVDTALRIAEEARVRPVSLTVAAHDLLALASVDRERHVVWVHRVGSSTDLLFLVGPVLVLSRSVPATDDAVVADEVRKSLVAVRWRVCDAVWVSGDGTTEALEGELGRLGAPLSQPPWTSRARTQLAMLPEEAHGTLMLALAVASIRRAPVLDLLPLHLRPRRLSRAQLLTLAMAGASVALLLGALLVPTFRESRYLARVNTEITRLDPEVRAVERVLRELERKRKLLATVDSLETSAVKPLPALRELTELLPTDAWLTTLSLDAKGIELTGQANSASALIPLLENSPRFERVEFASPVTRGRDREQFRIKASWEAMAATPTPPPPAAGTPPRVPGAPAVAPPAAGRPFVAPQVPPPPPTPPAGARPPGSPPAIEAPEPPPRGAEQPPQPPRPMPPNVGGPR